MFFRKSNLFDSIVYKREVGYDIYVAYELKKCVRIIIIIIIL